MLQAAQQSMEANLTLALIHESGGENAHALVNLAVAEFANLHGTPMLVAAEAARAAGNAPSAVLVAAVALVGPRLTEGARHATAAMIDVFSQAGLVDAIDAAFELSTLPWWRACRATPRTRRPLR